MLSIVRAIPVNQIICIILSLLQDTAPREEAKDSRVPYWTPGSTQGDIFQQMGRQKFLELPPSTLKMGRHLRTTGHSSTTVGEWDCPQGQFEVVVKSVAAEASDKDKLRLLKEAASMGQFRHANVVRFYGVVTLTDPVSGRASPYSAAKMTPHDVT